MPTERAAAETSPSLARATRKADWRCAVQPSWRLRVEGTGVKSGAAASGTAGGGAGAGEGGDLSIEQCCADYARVGQRFLPTSVT